MKSKTIKRLRREIIKTLPSIPNNNETKSVLESKTLTDLLIDYLAWKARLVTPRRNRGQIGVAQLIRHIYPRQYREEKCHEENNYFRTHRN